MASEKSIIELNGPELSLFSWTEQNTDGFGDVVISRFNDIGEIDLSDEEACVLIQRIKTRLNNGEHVTLRIAENEEQ